MPYVPGFTNDIFISFSHADNSDDWVQEFQQRLSHRLLQLGADVTFWRDKKLRGTDIFLDEILTQLQHSALLISIISPSAFTSPWCEDERQAFEHFAALNGGFRIVNQSRAIKVVKTPLAADHHRNLFGVTGFEYYKLDTQSDRIHEFHPTTPEFRERCDELAQDIKRLLDSFSQHLKVAPRKEIIYVATTTPDLEEHRNSVVRELEAWGCTVVPQLADPPPRAGVFQAVAKAEIAVSILSVHLVSDHPKPLGEGEPDSIVRQYELAKSFRKDRVVWVGPGRQLYSKFEESLEVNLQNGVEILRGYTLDYLTEVIGDKRKQLQSRPVRKSEARVELYFICDRKDHPSLEDSCDQRSLKVKDYLDENGLVVMPSPFSEMEWTQLVEEYGAQLQFSDAVLLYWGSATEDWFLKIRRIIVNERIRRSKTSSAESLTEAFYFSSPPMKKSQYRKLADFVFEQYEGFEPTALKPLLDRLLADEEAR